MPFDTSPPDDVSSSPADSSGGSSSSSRSISTGIIAPDNDLSLFDEVDEQDILKVFFCIFASLSGISD